MLDWTHFLVGCLAGSGVVLGNVILALVRRRNGHHEAVPVAPCRHDDDENGERITAHDLREAIHEVRTISQANALKLGLLERDVEWIKRSLRLNGYGNKE